MSKTEKYKLDPELIALVSIDFTAFILLAWILYIIDG